MSRFYGNVGGRRFLKIAKCACRQGTHQTEAAWKKPERQHIGHLHHDPRAALVFRGGLTRATRELSAEAAKARHAGLHADLGDRVLSLGEQNFGVVETGLYAELMRGESEYRFKLADEVKRRD